MSKQCKNCGAEVLAGDYRIMFCSDACRLAFRKKSKRDFYLKEKAKKDRRKRITSLGPGECDCGDVPVVIRKRNGFVIESRGTIPCGMRSWR